MLSVLFTATYKKMCLVHCQCSRNVNRMDKHNHVMLYLIEYFSSNVIQSENCNNWVKVQWTYVTNLSRVCQVESANSNKTAHQIN